MVSFGISCDRGMLAGMGCFMKMIRTTVINDARAIDASSYSQGMTRQCARYSLILAKLRSEIL